MKKIISLLFCLALVFSLAACSGTPAANSGGATSAPAASTEATVSAATQTSAAATTDNQAKKTIYFSIPGVSAAIWNVTANCMQKTASTAGYNCEVLNPNDDLETQLSQINTAISTGKMGALVIVSIDGSATSDILAKCEKAKIPVVCVDRACTGKFLTLIEADNYLCGQEMAKLYVNQLGSAQGNVLLVGGPLTNSPTVDRIKGFSDYVANYKNVKIVGSSNTEFVAEDILASVLNKLQAHPEINGIYTCTDTCLPGIISGLQETKKYAKVGEKGHVWLGSVDGDSFGLKQVQDGYCDATYNLDITKWCSEAVNACANYWKGAEVKDKILTPGDVCSVDTYSKLKDKGVLWGLG